MVYNKPKEMLVSASCDGTLGVYDLRKPELFALSDNFEEDLTSVCLAKDGKKVLAGTSEGIINLFSWGDFGDCNDRIVGHPGSIDAMVAYDNDTILTGCEDGLIRAVSILPNKIVSILSDPLDTNDEVFGIRHITLSHDKKLMASSSLDDIVRLLDVADVHERYKENFDEDAYEAQLGEKNMKAEREERKAAEQDSGDNDDDSDSEMWSDDSDDSDEKKKKLDKKDSKLNPKKPTLNQSKKLIEDKRNKDFFGDL